MILIIDNYDSFTYNIRDYLLQLGADVKVVTNDEITLDQFIALSPKALIISPGPCGPNDSGVCPEVVKWAFEYNLATLGICLGMQIIGHVLGYQIARAPIPVHGKTSMITTSEKRLFANTASKFNITRYHSLVIDNKQDLTKDFYIDATSSDDNQIMAISHKRKNLFGLQYHPESILSEYGMQQLSNFLAIANINQL